MKIENNKSSILNKEYSWEPSSDIYRDVDEAMEEIIEQHGGKFKGTVKVVITYDE